MEIYLLPTGTVQSSRCDSEGCARRLRRNCWRSSGAEDMFFCSKNCAKVFLGSKAFNKILHDRAEALRRR